MSVVTPCEPDAHKRFAGAVGNAAADCYRSRRRRFAVAFPGDGGSEDYLFLLYLIGEVALGKYALENCRQCHVGNLDGDGLDIGHKIVAVKETVTRLLFKHREHFGQRLPVDVDAYLHILCRCSKRRKQSDKDNQPHACCTSP